MSHLLQDYNYVMVDLPRSLNEIVVKAMEQSDVVYILTDKSSDYLEQTRDFLGDSKDSFRLTHEHIRLLAVESPIEGHITLKQVERFLKFPIFHWKSPVPLKDLPE